MLGGLGTKVGLFMIFDLVIVSKDLITDYVLGVKVIVDSKKGSMKRNPKSMRISV